jgi:hypothetical protein
MTEKSGCETNQQAFEPEDDSEPHAGAFAFGCGDGVVDAGDFSPGDEPLEA